METNDRVFRVNPEKMIKECKRLGLDPSPVLQSVEIENGVYKYVPPKDARYFPIFAGGRRMMAFCDSGSRVVSFMTRSTAKRLHLPIHRAKKGKEMVCQGIHGNTKRYVDFVRVSLDERRHGSRCVEKVWMSSKLAVGADLLASWRLSMSAGLRLININTSKGSYLHHASGDRTRQNEIDFLLAEKNLLPGRSALDGYAYPVKFRIDSKNSKLKSGSTSFEFDFSRAPNILKSFLTEPYDETEDETCFLSHSIEAEAASHARIEEIFHTPNSETAGVFPTTFHTQETEFDRDFTAHEFYKRFYEPLPPKKEQTYLVSDNPPSPENEEHKENEDPPQIDIGKLTEAEASLINVRDRIDWICEHINDVRLTRIERKRFKEMLIRTEKQFATGEFDVGRFGGKFAVADIELLDKDKIHRTRPYRQSAEEEKIIDKRIKELLEGGIIE
ncbi:MAG: hypothetical protein GY940_02560, partial [bacterium]|nr:hypothetical protein [bacterium]